MAFASLTFLSFIFLGVVLYYLVPRRFQWMVLLAASYAFYLWNGIVVAGYLLVTTASTYAAGLLLGRLNRAETSPAESTRISPAEFARSSPAKSTRSSPAAPERVGNGNHVLRAVAPETRTRTAKKLTVLFTLLLNFGMLFLLKYWDDTASVAARLLQLQRVPALNWIMPLGVSFYIFQSVGYVIDVYRKKSEPERNPFRFALFVSFFPQLVQGPISRFDQLAPQLFARRSLDWDNLKYGIQLMMWGYFKKLVIAERAGVLVNTVFAKPDAHDGAVTAFAVFFYCIQLYCDFSGGIDISRGVARMLGIDLIDNFQRPLFAVSLTDYWRRWHISLGAWMKDYLFYPLSFSKPFRALGRFSRSHIGGLFGKILPTSLATFVVYFVIGIWHGANFRFLFFGVWNGVIITSSLLLAPQYAAIRKALKIREEGLTLRIFRMARTALLVFVGRYITRAPRLLSAFAMMGITVTRFRPQSLVDGSLLQLGLNPFAFWTVLAGMAVVVMVEYLQECGVRMRIALEQRPFVVQWLAILVPLAVILLLGVFNQTYTPGAFIYAQF